MNCTRPTNGIGHANPLHKLYLSLYKTLASTAYMLPEEDPSDEERHAHAQALLPLYRSLVEDSDPLIQNKAYQLIGVLGSKEGLNLLERHIELAGNDVDPRRKIAIRRAIDINRSLLNSSK